MKQIRSIYLIGSLRNKNVPLLAEKLRAQGYEVFDDWYASGRRADDEWRSYEKHRKHTFKQALNDHFAGHVFEFDMAHLNRCDAAVLLLPAGRSGHLELGYVIGKGKPSIIVIPKEPKRFDVMYKFATDVAVSETELFSILRRLNGALVTNNSGKTHGVPVQRTVRARRRVRRNRASVLRRVSRTGYLPPSP